MTAQQVKTTILLQGKGILWTLTWLTKCFPSWRQRTAFIFWLPTGTPVLEQNCEAHGLTIPRLVGKYLAFTERIIWFERKTELYHGDIHVGNVTYFAAEDSFMLIDYDEARSSELVIRKAHYPEQERLYPDVLLKFAELHAELYAKLYTKHQLMMALEDILRVYDRNRECSSVATFFEDYPLPAELKPEDVATRYETLVALLKEFGKTVNYRFLW